MQEFQWYPCSSRKAIRTLSTTEFCIDTSSLEKKYHFPLPLSLHIYSSQPQIGETENKPQPVWPLGATGTLTSQAQSEQGQQGPCRASGNTALLLGLAPSSLETLLWPWNNWA